ncbi:hypothetical protein EON63_02725 [archaeon]|nr:MAG: hypothetical protein EON63_02725 [archaeon]
MYYSIDVYRAELLDYIVPESMLSWGRYACVAVCCVSVWVYACMGRLGFMCIHATCMPFVWML